MLDIIYILIIIVLLLIIARYVLPILVGLLVLLVATIRYFYHLHLQSEIRKVFKK
nr:MAG TPA: hypothetical protein [Caudoviricetes sp.]